MTICLMSACVDLSKNTQCFGGQHQELRAVWQKEEGIIGGQGDRTKVLERLRWVKSLRVAIAKTSWLVTLLHHPTFKLFRLLKSALSAQSQWNSIPSSLIMLWEKCNVEGSEGSEARGLKGGLSLECMDHASKIVTAEDKIAKRLYIYLLIIWQQYQNLAKSHWSPMLWDCLWIDTSFF